MNRTNFSPSVQSAKDKLSLGKKSSELCIESMINSWLYD